MKSCVVVLMLLLCMTVYLKGGGSKVCLEATTAYVTTINGEKVLVLTGPRMIVPMMIPLDQVKSVSKECCT